MQLLTNSARLLILLLTISFRCLASGYRGDMADAWSKSSIVVLGRPQIVRPSANETLDAQFGGLELGVPERGTYVIEVQRAYKGAKQNDRIEFVDLSFGSTAALRIHEGGAYLVFLRTKEDRSKQCPAKEELGEAVTGLCAIRADDRDLAEIEAGITTIRTYETLAPQDRKAFLLQNLAIRNRYSHRLIVREIVSARITEAVPYFQERLSQATDETEKLDLACRLGRLGDPTVRETLVSWLADQSFKRRMYVIEAMIGLRDPSLIPVIRRYVDDKDEMVAVEARTALLRMGDPEGKSLCLAMIAKSNNWIVRYNAIHYLNWGNPGEFTDKEKEIIRDLVRDNNPDIARVAGFIVEKWKPVSNKPSEAPR